LPPYWSTGATNYLSQGSAQFNDFLFLTGKGRLIGPDNGRFTVFSDRRRIIGHNILFTAFFW
jgi:hypothetical protein